MEEYRSGMSSLYSLLLEAGEDNTDFTNWDEATQTAFWEKLNEAGPAFAQSIADFCIANGYNAEGDSIAACAAKRTRGEHQDHCPQQSHLPQHPSVHRIITLNPFRNFAE
jgi:peptide/nickel transport system substrate-binding protein